jgi:hypothetical protein
VHHASHNAISIDFRFDRTGSQRDTLVIGRYVVVFENMYFYSISIANIDPFLLLGAGVKLQQHQLIGDNGAGQAQNDTAGHVKELLARQCVGLEAQLLDKAVQLDVPHGGG